MDIKVLKRDEIDDQKWDSCVHFAPNGNIFSYTWYLDCIYDDWHGIVESGYTSVMPLFVKKKGIFKQKYFQNSDLIPYTGLSTCNVTSPKRIESFLTIANEQASYGKVILNEKNFHHQLKNLSLHSEVLFHSIFLGEPYESISQKYSSILLNGLSQTNVAYVFESNAKVEDVINSYQKNNHLQLNDFNYHAYHRILYQAIHRGIAQGAVLRDEKGKNIASFFLIFGQGKAHIILPSYDKACADKWALHRLVDVIFRTNAGRPTNLIVTKEWINLFEGFPWNLNESPYLSKKQSGILSVLN